MHANMNIWVKPFQTLTFKSRGVNKRRRENVSERNVDLRVLSPHLSIATFSQNFQQLKAFGPDLLCSLVHAVLWNFKLLTVIHVTGKTKQKNK